MSNDKNVLMWSGGTNSTALGLAMMDKGIKFDIVIERVWFKDGVPRWLPHYDKWFKTIKKKFEQYGCTVIEIHRESLWDNANKIYNKSKYPNLVGKKYGFNACSNLSCKYKVLLGTTVNFMRNSNIYFGNVLKTKGVSSPTYAIRYGNVGIYPFIRLGLTEDAVIKLYDKYEVEKPPLPRLSKHGCFFCPYIKPAQREYIKDNYPEYYQYMVDMVNVEPAYPKFNIPLDHNWYNEITGIYQHENVKINRNPYIIGEVNSLEEYIQKYRTDLGLKYENYFRED